jgi:hypothetical protein
MEGRDNLDPAAGPPTLLGVSVLYARLDLTSAFPSTIEIAY